MYGQNPLADALASDYENAGSIVNSLTDIEERLIGKIGFWQNAIKNSDSTSNQANEEKNISSWFRFSNVSYSSSNLRVSDKYKYLIKKFSEDPNYLFKNIVETITRELIHKHLRGIKGLEDSQIKVLNTSDHDDITGGVDLIVEIIDNLGNKSILGLDVAVSNNKDYLEKKEIRTETICMEYNLANGGAPMMPIMREVLQFQPQVIAKLIYEYLSIVENGGHINILDLYREIYKNNYDNMVEYPQISTLIKGTKENIGHILQIN